MPLSDCTLELVEVLPGPVLPLAQRPVGQFSNQGGPFDRAGRHLPGGKQAGSRLEVLGSDFQDLGHRAHLVSELQAGIPQRIPDPFGYAGHVQAVSVYQDYIEVAARALLAPSVSADGHQGHPGRHLGSLEDSGQVFVEPTGQRSAERRSLEGPVVLQI